jgi:hypothetical protein
MKWVVSTGEICSKLKAKSVRHKATYIEDQHLPPTARCLLLGDLLSFVNFSMPLYQLRFDKSRVLLIKPMPAKKKSSPKILNTITDLTL